MVKVHTSLQPQGVVRRKFILKYPLELKTCSLNFRVTTNCEVGKYAMVIIPTLRPTPTVMEQEQRVPQACHLPTFSYESFNMEL